MNDSTVGWKRDELVKGSVNLVPVYQSEVTAGYLARIKVLEELVNQYADNKVVVQPGSGWFSEPEYSI